jgi:hypothetical protein
MSLDMASGMPPEMPANRPKSRETADASAENFASWEIFPIGA